VKDLATQQPPSNLENLQPPLLSKLRYALQSQHDSRRTDSRIAIGSHGSFHHPHRPDELAVPEINDFLNHLALKQRVSASTQTQALSAILFLYRYPFTERSAHWII
jgi:hypothetical protein